MIVDLKDEAAQDISIAGGKGSELARLLSRGYPVPEGFVITSGAFEKFLVGNNLETENGTDSSEQIQARIRASRLPEKLAEELKDRMEKYEGSLGTKTRWAVRSSAAAEDRTDASFAGQYDTLLGLAGMKAVAQGILQCWASFFNVHSLRYRQERNISDTRAAVVVQRMIEAEAAGVCFSVDPVSRDADRVVINSNFGLGASVVDGLVTPDTFVIGKKDRQVEFRQIAAKELKTAASANGIQQVVFEGPKRQRASLDDDQAIAIAKMAIDIERDENRAVDIEWAISGGKTHLLQSRPITTLTDHAQSPYEEPPEGWVPELNTDIDPRYPLYSNGNISEVLPGCITPLSWDYIAPTIEKPFRSQGVALGAMEESGPEYQVLGFFYHRPYICVSFLEEAMARTPGMSPDTIHEEFIGPPEVKTPPLTWSDLRPDRWPKIFKVISISLRKSRSLASETLKCEKTILRLRRESTPEMLKTWSDQQLIKAVCFSEETVSTSNVHIWASSFAVIFFDLLRKLAEKWLGDQDGSLAARMVTGIGTLPSADPAFGLFKLAREAKATPEIEGLFASISDNRLLYENLRKDENSGRFNEILDLFLATYGHRAVCEAEFRNPCWREDPAQVLGLVRNYLQTDVTSPEEVRTRQNKLGEKAAQRIETISLPKQIILKYTLRKVRLYIELRERLKDMVVLRSDRARRIYAEIRQRLLDRGDLENPDDLFFLIWREVDALIGGRLSPEEVKKTVSRRRRDFDWCEHVQVPKIQDGAARTSTTHELPSDQQLKGIGVSPGIVEGRARVIHDLRTESHIESGEILIAPVTDAGWTPLFINAGGLVVAVGGLLSHGSVVAREYGLPAVVGVSDATRRIKTGDRVRLDGSSGTVTIREHST
ncbi:MAG: hypothetical protein GY866_28030 [Proteobacteria bacterium]|nr:hypothetical protein [Pseudomonadota bacterium]